MGMILTKSLRGQPYRCSFSANSPLELAKVVAIASETPKGGKVTFAPDETLISKILYELPGTTVDPYTKSWYEAALDQNGKILRHVGSVEESSAVIGPYTLRADQEEAVRFVCEASRAILGSDRGLGKTIMGCAIIARLLRDTNLLVLPAYLFNHWEGYLGKCCGDFQVFVVRGTKPKKNVVLEQYKNHSGKKILLVSYNFLTSGEYKIFFTFKFDLVLFDEAHALSNRKNMWTKTAFRLSERCENLVLLSGSDLTRIAPNTLWPLLHCINPRKFSSYWNFFYRFVDYYEDWHGPVVVGPKNLAELSEVLAPIRIRRTKDEVGFMLPPKIYTTHYVDLEPEHRDVYDAVLEERLNKESGLSIPEGVAMFSYLQRLVNMPYSLGYSRWSPKTDTVVSLAQDIVAEGQKVIIFGWHKEYLRFLASTLLGALRETESEPSCVMIDGDISQSVRDRLVQQFKTNDKTNVLIATIATAGTGLDLPEASNVIFVESHWNPEVMGQAEDRAHRVNSKSPVNVYKIWARNTVDEYIDAVAMDKEHYINEANAIMRAIQLMKGGIVQ